MTIRKTTPWTHESRRLSRVPQGNCQDPVRCVLVDIVPWNHDAMVVSLKNRPTFQIIGVGGTAASPTKPTRHLSFLFHWPTMCGAPQILRIQWNLTGMDMCISGVTERKLCGRGSGFCNRGGVLTGIFHWFILDRWIVCWGCGCWR